MTNRTDGLDAAGVAPAKAAYRKSAEVESLADTIEDWLDPAIRNAIAAYLEATRRSALVDAPAGEGKPLAWVPEDELPESLPTSAYNELFPHSRVDCIRFFPVFGPTPSVAALQAEKGEAHWLRKNAVLVRELGNSMSPGALAAAMERRADALDAEAKNPAKTAQIVD